MAALGPVRGVPPQRQAPPLAAVSGRGSLIGAAPTRSCSAGRITGTACGCRSRSTSLVMAPPRTGKTGWLARVIMHYPGAVLSTTTRAGRLRAHLGPPGPRGRPGRGIQPAASAGSRARSAGLRSTGCEDRAVAIRRADAFANAVDRRARQRVLPERGPGLPAGDVPRGRARRRGYAAWSPLWALTGEPGRRATGRGDPAANTAPPTGPLSFPSCAARPTKPPRPTRSS